MNRTLLTIGGFSILALLILSNSENNTASIRDNIAAPSTPSGTPDNGSIMLNQNNTPVLPSEDIISFNPFSTTSNF